MPRPAEKRPVIFFGFLLAAITMAMAAKERANVSGVADSNGSMLWTMASCRFIGVKCSKKFAENCPRPVGQRIVTETPAMTRKYISDFSHRLLDNEAIPR